jgi:hypothetical protein
MKLKKDTTDDQINTEIDRILREFPEVFDTQATIPLDRGSNNFKIRLVARMRPQVR